MQLVVLSGIEDVSSAGLLLLDVYAMMFIGGIPWKKLVAPGGTLIIVAVLGGAILMSIPEDTKIPVLHRGRTWINRVLDFTNNEYVPPAKFDIDKNGQVAHAKIAIATSNFIGKAPGNSVQRDFLSQSFSDFIFAIIFDAFGLFGGGFVVILYIWLLIRAEQIARKCNRPFPA